jgi:hypothetical protein
MSNDVPPPAPVTAAPGRWQHDERAERAGHSAERRVKEGAEHLRHEWHEHVDRDYD